MYSRDSHKCVCQKMNVPFHITRLVCKSMYLHNIFLLFCSLGPWSRSAMCMHASVGYSSLKHHAYASTIYREMGKQRGGGSVPLLASFETRCVIGRPSTSLEAIKNSSQAGAEESLYLHSTNGPIILCGMAFTGVSGAGERLGNDLCEANSLRLNF